MYDACDEKGHLEPSVDPRVPGRRRRAGTTDVEVDPHLEVAAIQKHFDGGAALLFNKVKGYPNARVCNNIFASAERIAQLLDVDDPRKLKHKVVEALRAPCRRSRSRTGPVRKWSSRRTSTCGTSSR